MASPATQLSRVRITPYGALRMVLGLILLSAAVLKGHQLATEPVAEAGLFTSRWFLIAVVEFELFFGLWLFSGAYSRRAWQAAVLCFSTFAWISLYKAISGEATCGCFGRVSVNPWCTLILDLTAIRALLWCRLAAHPEISPRPLAGEGPGGRAGRRRQLALLVAIFLAAGIPAGLAMGTYQAATLDASGDIFGENQFVVLEPEKWVGKRFPLLNYIDIGDQLTKGQWLVVLYRDDCPKCRALIRDYQRLSAFSALDGLAPRVALVEMPPYGGWNGSIPSGRVRAVLGHSEHTREWFGGPPIRVLLKEGLVVGGKDWDAHVDADSAYWRERQVARGG